MGLAVSVTRRKDKRTYLIRGSAFESLEMLCVLTVCWWVWLVLLVGVMMGLIAVNVLIRWSGSGGRREGASVLATCRHQEMSTSAVMVLGCAIWRWWRSGVGRG